ncbi:hypothetical protein L9F63_024386, partial [Diploptera punctata]
GYAQRVFLDQEDCFLLEESGVVLTTVSELYIPMVHVFPDFNSMYLSSNGCSGSAKKISDIRSVYTKVLSQLQEMIHQHPDLAKSPYEQIPHLVSNNIVDVPSHVIMSPDADKPPRVAVEEENPDEIEESSTCHLVENFLSKSLKCQTKSAIELRSWPTSKINKQILKYEELEDYIQNVLDGNASDINTNNGSDVEDEPMEDIQPHYAWK